MSDYAELLKLAKAATPGPWECICADRLYADFEVFAANRETIGCDYSVENAAYIAKADPQTIIGLVERVEESALPLKRLDWTIGDNVRKAICIADLESKLSDSVSGLRLLMSWAENWDSPFLEDDEWVSVDKPKIQSILQDTDND